MGSKISVQDIDQKASDFAKANFMKQLKEHHQNLERENKHYKEANANLQRKLDEESKLWRELKEENKELKKQLEDQEVETKRDQILRELDDK
jgi:CII-binding regulator of phage lambda lysogenization HflD